MIKTFILSSLMIFLIGCSHHAAVKLPQKPYLKDKVSVQTVLMQTHAAYLRGCMEAHKSYDASKKWFKVCKNEADSYLESDVISIIEQ